MKTSLIAATLLSASMISGAANAQESVLQSFLTNMVNTAVSTTANEIRMDVYQSVANAAYHFELDANDANGTGSVSVTDLAATEKSSDSTEEDAD
ncbi:MAG: hypothetical protein VXZ36_04925 [Pseudomonadota bacterium]|nr:hypothetical protein [Pseudomonadota bacterium]